MKSVQLIVATFENDETKAGQVLEGLQEAAKEGVLYIDAAATIVKPKEGDIKVKDVGDVKSKQGRVFGAISGAVIGLLGGPVGAIVGGIAGAATGGIAASVIDRGVPDKMIEDVKKGLQPGSSAIIAYAELDWIDVAIASLKKEGAVVHHETLGSAVMSNFIQDLDKNQSKIMDLMSSFLMEVLCLMEVLSSNFKCTTNWVMI